jgi:hypothetical protein
MRCRVRERRITAFILVINEERRWRRGYAPTRCVAWATRAAGSLAFEILAVQGEDCWERGRRLWMWMRMRMGIGRVAMAVVVFELRRNSAFRSRQWKWGLRR